MVQKATRGFSLVELMIVMAIMAILAAIAIPSYQRYVLRTHRTDAMSALQGLAQAMERHYVQRTPLSSYEGAAVGGADTGAPSIYSSVSPIDGGAARYDLRITAANATSYTLQAEPRGAQAGDGKLRLTSTGVRSWDRNDDDTFSARWSDN